MASISEDSGEETPLQVRFLFIVLKALHVLFVMFTF